MHATLLVVESDCESGQVLSMYLEQQSYHVVLVEGHEQAREKLSEFLPSMILFDLDEPGTGWREFYKWLRHSSNAQELPCIWIASQVSEMALSFSKGEHDHLLQKPLDPDVFLDLIAHHTRQVPKHVTSQHDEAGIAAQDSRIAVQDSHIKVKVATSSQPIPFSPNDPSVDAWIESLQGRMIGSVVLEKELGRGGMGVVFQGSQISLHRKVAVKIMLPQLTKKLSTVERFQREALATAKLKSQNIVQIFEAGTTDDHLFFIVMEWLEGETLEARIQRERFIDAVTALDLIMQTTKGLAVAHQAGLIHRDLKPSNLIVGGDGHVSITDFGLVYNQHTPRHTQSGIVVGTPHYLSPEQASGQSIDARSDIYALGILFFELLTGHVPFESDNLTNLLIAHIQTPLPDPRLSVPGIPESFIPVLNKMAAKDPNKRYQNADELYQSLEYLSLSWESADAPPPSPEFASSVVEDANELSMSWVEPEPLHKGNELLKTQVAAPMPSIIQSNQISNLSSGHLSYHELHKQASTLTPSSLTPTSPHWNTLQMQGMMLVDYQGNLLQQEGAVQAHWLSALAILLGHAQQIDSAVSLGSWEFSVLETPYASLFLLPKEHQQILAIVRPPREQKHLTQASPLSFAQNAGPLFSRLIQSLHALAGVSNILLYDRAVQLMDARLGQQTDPYDYPLKMSPIIHMLMAIPWEQASLVCRFSEGKMRFFPVNGAFLCVQTTRECNQSLLSMMVDWQSAAMISAHPSGTTPAPPSTTHLPGMTPAPPSAAHPSGITSTPRLGHSVLSGASQHGMSSLTAQPLSPPSGAGQYSGASSGQYPIQYISQHMMPAVQDSSPFQAPTSSTEIPPPTQVPMSSVPSHTPAPAGAISALSRSSLSSISPVTPMSINNPRDCLTSDTIEQLTHLFIRYAGPIGKIVVSKTIRKMGFNLDQFPTELTQHLLEQLAGRIKGDKRTDFTQHSNMLMKKKNGNVLS